MFNIVSFVHVSVFPELRVSLEEIEQSRFLLVDTRVVAYR
jgi:hypothetical protein